MARKYNRDAFGRFASGNGTRISKAVLTPSGAAARAAWKRTHRTIRRMSNARSERQLRAAHNFSRGNREVSVFAQSTYGMIRERFGAPGERNPVPISVIRAPYGRRSTVRNPIGPRALRNRRRATPEQQRQVGQRKRSIQQRQKRKMDQALFPSRQVRFHVDMGFPGATAKARKAARNPGRDPFRPWIRII
jgi:hypothetical protein